MRTYNYGPELLIDLPVSGGGSALVSGAALARGISGSQPYGHLVLATGTSAVPDIVGILREAHATANDTDAAGTVFTTHPVEIMLSSRLLLVEYSQASADLITCTQAVSTTTITLTSLEDDIDTGGLYVAAGTGIGQINYLTAAGAGSATLKAAFTTDLDTSSKVVKILPRFHQLGSLNSDGTKLSSQAAAGAVQVSIVDTLIERNGRREQFNPVKHSALTGLSGLHSFRIYAVMAFRNTFIYTVD